ncbi:XrtA/PEP-CTERM system-associated ATPase [Aquabacterium sp.]|uniref:XrtA/PEP-CTERM system-associated ATPase n=1 Tax=Aquabacterium sp. TaxID=1872578 RepID=UPI0025B99FF1|nr:XrtA/PEP-CTERM system-associated ATPase [Aquabacterium sp.]
MYESHFGLTAPPFLLNPDPGFFFDSKGHASALSYLKFGLYQAEGFIVITGDIGAGKTTLVRTLLADIDTEKVVAAQLVSTQLEAGDLLRSAITAFGIPFNGHSKAELIATLEAYLTLLATQKKRAVLIVDEAQNLSRDAVEELRMLSNFQFGNQALLQSFLIGQPELRDMLLSRSLEQLRQRVIASYHLGPMDRGETRRYIEHRLRKVGWTDKPRFDEEAFDEVHQWTSGIPRRINLLCNRLLLATYLADGVDITAANVAAIAMEIRSEIGEALPHRSPGPATAGMSAVAPHTTPANQASSLPGTPPKRTDSLEAPLDVRHPAEDAPLSGLYGINPPEPNLDLRTHDAGDPSEPFFLIVSGSRSACLRTAALRKAFANRAELPALKHLHIDTPGRFELTNDWAEHMGLGEPHFRLRLQSASASALLADALRQIDHLLQAYPPVAVIVQDGEDAALAASLAAHRQGVPIVHMEAGLRSFDRRHAHEINAMMCDHMADLLLTSEWVAHDNLTREGIPTEKVLFVGNALIDTIRGMLPQASAPKYTLRQFNHDPELLKGRHGYGLVSLSQNGLIRDPDAVVALMTVLRAVARELPLVWPIQAEQRDLLARHGVLSKIEAPGSGFVVLPIVPYFKMIGLVGTATCVFTDVGTVQEEATIMGVPCLTLQNHCERRITIEQGTNTAVGVNGGLISRAVVDIMRGNGKKGRLPKFWDGATGGRVTEHLSAWYQNHRQEQANRQRMTAAPAQREATEPSP